MKTKKIILSICMILLAFVAFVGCDESNLLNRLEDATKSIDTVSSSYETAQLDENIELMALNESSITAKTLSEDLPLVTFNQLRQDLLAKHLEILETRETLVALRQSISEKVGVLKENDFILIDEDKTMIREDIEALRQMRTDLIGTRGKAYQRIYDLRGQYSRDNLTMINETFSEVLSVLDQRLTILLDAVTILENIDTLLSDYMEI